MWIYNNEDPIDELRRRLAAICINWNITPGDLQPRLFLDSGLDRRLIVMKQEHRIVAIAQATSPSRLTGARSRSGQRLP